jgi:DNA-binding PadR family transcriptional regulator
MTKVTDAASLVPLRPVIFEILLILNQDARHGYGLMKELRERPAGRWVLGPGTLYRTLREMQTQKLIEPDSSIVDDADPRRRYYRLTDFGRRVATAEAHRMETLVRLARDGALLTTVRG